MSPRRSKPAAPPVAYPVRQLLRDLWGFLAPYQGKLIFATVVRAVGDTFNLVPWFALSKVVTLLGEWKPGQSQREIYLWAVALPATMLLRQVCMFVSKLTGFLVGEKAALDVRERGMAHLLRLDIAWHERENSGNKMKRIENGAEAVNRFVRMWFGNLIEIGVTFVGVLWIMAVTEDRFVAFATLVFVAIYAPVSWYMRRKASVASRAVNAEQEKLAGAMFESINNVRTAKVLDMPASLLRIIGKHAAMTYEKTRTRIRLFQTRNAVQGALAITFRGAAILYIAYGIFHGRFEVGFLVLFGGYFNRLTDAATELSDVAQDAEVSRYSMARMTEMFDQPVIDPGTKPYPADWNTISLRNVSYSYGDREVLHGITFTIRRGERVGVVGLSGAGKSTLFKLLLKELEDYTGDILFDDVPLRDIRKPDYYRHAAVVLQETEVFNFPLRQNITIAARGGANDRARLRRSLDIAHVTDFLPRLPNGVETMIGEKGVKLSGGERQRVGIARAVFKRPDVLFLDEATSHLDLESEERIRDSLHQFFRNVTAVVIAHRLTTIREMHRIVVLEKGRLIEQGSFDELIARRGRFRELWDKQKLGEPL